MQWKPPRPQPLPEQEYEAQRGERCEGDGQDHADVPNRNREHPASGKTLGVDLWGRTILPGGERSVKLRCGGRSGLRRLRAIGCKVLRATRGNLSLKTATAWRPNR